MPDSIDQVPATADILTAMVTTATPGITLVGMTLPWATTGIVDLATSIADLDVSLIEAVHGSCDVVTQGEQASGRC